MPRLTIFYFLILGFSSVGSATALEINASLGLAVDSAASLEDLSPNAGSLNSHSDNVTIFEAGIAGEPLSGLTFSYDFSSEEFTAKIAPFLTVSGGAMRKKLAIGLLV
jgi:hypothetical protein